MFEVPTYKHAACALRTILRFSRKYLFRQHIVIEEWYQEEEEIKDVSYNQSLDVRNGKNHIV